ncbi:MAG: PH domain-containing protein [Anaerolineae bacterium]
MQPPMPANQTPALRFHTQRPNEIVLLETRRHWWAWVRWLPVSVLMAAAGVGAGLALPLFGGVFIVLGLVFALAFGLYLYADWINDSIFITDQRVVRIQRNLLRFSQTVSEIPLASIQEINADIPNWDLFALAFHYGYVAVRTSGNAGDVKLSMIPDPDKVQDLILMDMRQYRAAQSRQQGSDEMRRMIERVITPGNAVEAFAAPPRPTTVGPVRAPWSPFIPSYPAENGAIVFRHHWYVWVKMVWLPLLVLIGAFVSLFALQWLGLGAIGFGISFMLFVIGGAWFLWQDTDFRNDYMIVTDNTITLLHQRPLWLQNERDVLLLKRVDNIISEQQGLINQLLNKGTLRFTLIGANEYKTFKDVYNPLGVQAELTRRQGQARQQAALEQQDQQQAIIAQYLQTYHEMMEERGLLPPTQGSPMPTAPSFVPSPMPAPRPALSEGRPYQPHIPTQPPPYQMPQATGSFPVPQAAPPSASIPPISAPPPPPSLPPTFYVPPSAPSAPPEDAPPPPPLFPRPPSQR